MTTERVQCLECGQSFRALGPHLSRVHAMSARQYRARHDLPASYPLAADDLRAEQSRRILEMHADGSLNNDPAAASAAARAAGRGRRTAADLAEQAERARRIPHRTIPPGGRRADGRDADHAREYQRQRRRRANKGLPTGRS